MGLFLSLFFSFSLQAKVLTLKDALLLAEKQNAEVRTESFKAAIAATDADLIRGEIGPKINALAGVGPINSKRGNIFGYTDENSWGPQWVASIEAKIPLVVWGRSDNLQQAVQLNTEISQQDHIKKQQEIRFKVKEAYWGWQYALSLKDFVSTTQSDLDEAIKILEKKNSKKEDLLRLEVFKYQVQEKLIQIQKSLRLAEMGVSFYTGEKPEADKKPLENEREWIEMDKRELKELEYYMERMQKHAPDLQKVARGIQAKNQLLLSEKKSQYPVLGALIKYDFAKTAQRDAQKNPYIFDRYNQSVLAAGVGLTWDIDFGVKKSKQDKLVLEMAELQSKEHFASEGLKVLVQKAYMEVLEAEGRAESLQKAYRAAKKWLTNMETSVGLGLTPPKEIIDAYTTRALVFKDYYEALYHYQLAWARLSEICGIEVDPLLQ